MSNRKTTPMVLIAGLTLGFAAQAAEPATAQAEVAPSMVVSIDKATGKLRQPTAAEMASLRSRASKTTLPALRGLNLPKTHAEAARRATRLPNGAMQLEASEDSFSSLVMTRHADGSYSTQHVNSDGQALPVVKAVEKASE